MEIPNVILWDGRTLSDGAGINILNCMSVRNIMRFSSHDMPGRWNVAEHMYLCGLLVPSYCAWMAENFMGGKHRATYESPVFQNLLHQHVLTHDLEEIVYNDAPTQVGGDKIMKSWIRCLFRKFLKTQETDAQVVKAAGKHLDTVAAYVESVYYWLSAPHRPGSRAMVKFYGTRIFKYELDEYVKLVCPADWVRYAL